MRIMNAAAVTRVAAHQLVRRHCWTTSDEGIVSLQNVEHHSFSEDVDGAILISFKMNQGKVDHPAWESVKEVMDQVDPIHRAIAALIGDLTKTGADR